MVCALCGLPTPSPPIWEQGRPFCCYGCSEVFRVFGPNILTRGEPRPSAEAMPAPRRHEETFLRVDGMHCAACEYLIVRAAEKVDGIVAVVTSFATGTAKVTYDPDRISEADLPKRLSRHGYRVRHHLDSDPMDEGADRRLLRLVTGVGLAGMVMMLNLAFFYPIDLGLVSENELAPVGWLAFDVAPRAMLVLTTLLIFGVGYPILRGAWVGLRAGVPGMDSLLAIAILSAYGFSIGEVVSGGLDLYFDVAAMIVSVVTIGRYVERGARASATQELTRIINAWTRTARVRRVDGLENIAVRAVRPGDRVVVYEREAVPVDGIITQGQGAIDDSLITGEPLPVARAVGEALLGGSRVVEGAFEIEVGAQVESRLENLVKALWRAQCSTSGAVGIADRIARVFVPLVLLLAAMLTGWLLLEGAPAGHALLAGLATLVVSCPCSLGLAVPLATAAAVNAALREGIIIASGDVLDKAPRFETIAIDKTGTLSTGVMTVAQVVGDPCLVEYAAAVERCSPHPIAAAIARLDHRREAEDYVAYPGKGAVASVDGRRVAVGSAALFAVLGWQIPALLKAELARRSPGDGAISFAGWDGLAVGAFVTQDRCRSDWQEVVEGLSRDRRIVLLTGAEHSGGYDGCVDESHAGVPPEAKAAIVRQLKARGPVVMIGDGSNDAAALAAADLGIAFGAPTSLAAQAADVIVLGDRLSQVFVVFELIATARRRVRQNIGWAFLYNAIAVPLALAGWLNPLFAALAMSASSLLVVWNSTRPMEGAGWNRPAAEQNTALAPAWAGVSDQGPAGWAV